MKIILVGSIGRFPVAGHAWVNRQYLQGFAALGHDVYYLEDAGDDSYVYDWDRQELTTDLSYPAGFVRRALEPIGLGDRWVYRTSGEAVGMSVDTTRQLCRDADLLLVRGAPMPIWREEYLRPRCRAYLDVDPMFTQVRAATGDRLLAETIERCSTLFTIGRRLGAPDCPIPTLGRRWHTTVSPVYLPEWPVAEEEPPATFSTIMQWSAYRAVHWQGREYGNKTSEFPRFTDVARRADAAFCVAMTGRPPEHLNTDGWLIVSGERVTATPEDYRRFIRQSCGEFSVAKHGYVASRGGWFSDRSACYLAAGRPVIVQDTGLADWLPVGAGVLTFRTTEQALRCVHSVLSDYSAHRTSARTCAADIFATAKVLPAMLDALE